MKTKAYNLVNSVEQEELDAGLLAEYYFVEANDGKSITLPAAFSSDVREDVIPSAGHEALRRVVGQGARCVENHA